MRRWARILPIVWCFSAVLGQQAPPPAGAASPAGGTARQPPGLKQRPAEAPGSGTKPGTKVRPITLNVVVMDVGGKPVASLTRDDFSILDNGQPKPIAGFKEANGAEAASDPVQATLLIDTLSNSFESVAAERAQIETFLRRDGGRLPMPVSIVLFSDSGAQIDQPTRDGNLLTAELKKTFIAIPTLNAAMGATGAIERYQRSLKVLNQLMVYEGAKPGRKLLLWIGPGWPMLSGGHFSPSERDQYGYWQSIVNISTDLRMARITLYSVETLSSEMSLAHGVYYQNFLKPVTNRKRADSGNLALPVLAIQSGGRVINGSNDLVAEILSCLEDGKSYYTITFDAAPSEQPDEYRSLEVRIGKPGLTARTNSGYYAQPGSF